MAKQTKETTVETVDTAEVKETAKPEQGFSKEQILASAKYSNRRDLLTVLLEDGKSYTAEQVEQVMNDWFKKGVK